MSFFGRTKKIIKPLVDVPKWIGYRQFLASQRSLFSFVKKFFVPEQSKSQETFQEAIQRLKLTEVDLKKRLKEFTRLFKIWLLLFIFCLSYSFYLLTQHAYRGFFPCLGVAFIIVTQIFRYHFWIFQIKQRRLGCRFRDWLTHQFSFGKKKQ